MSQKSIRIAINGLGRIGRTILRLALTQKVGVKVVAVNDIAPIETCAYLFKYDSIFGPFPHSVITSDNGFSIDGQNIRFTQSSDLSGVDMTDVDVLLECTGKANSIAIASRGLNAGAGRVLISGPSDATDTTIVLGANDHIMNDQAIVSNASCTTNALAPLMRVLDDAFGLISGHMTTIHCYTGSQPTIDAPRDNLARSRAAGLSMVPTTTSAGRLIDMVLPHLAGRVEARAIRVPTASVSAIDLSVQTNQRVTCQDANKVLLDASLASPNIIGWIDEPLVSSDLRSRPESIILSGLETSVSVGGVLRVFGWYDNEWGFSNRMIDVALRMGAQK